MRLDDLARALSFDLDPARRASLERYVAEVKLWNAKLDLTAAGDGDALLEVLVADALVLAREAVIPRDTRLVDIGSGAGAPALSLLILRPDLRATLVEPLRKRVAFLRSTLGALGLAPRVRVVEGRIDEDHLAVEGAPFDLALSRATFPPERWIPLGLALAPEVLVLTAAASPEPKSEARIAHVEPYALPFSQAPRHITRIARVVAT